MQIRCNAGWSYTTQMGEMSSYPGEIWYNPDGIANILLLANVSKHFGMHFDSANKQAFLVKKSDGTTKCFILLKASLYYHDTAHVDLAGSPRATTYVTDHDTTLVHTVDANWSKYTAHLYSQAVLAHKIQNMIGYPSMWDLLNIVEHCLLPNCPISKADILAAEDIFGPNVASLKGKTV